jgi:hypothetical protein
VKANELLPIFISSFVPLQIAELRDSGGVTQEDISRAQSYLPDFGSRGDALLYRVPGVTGDLAGKLVDAIAVLSFCPGGITIFGQHFEGESCKQ